MTGERILVHFLLSQCDYLRVLCYLPSGTEHGSGVEVKREEGGEASSSGEPVCLSLCAVGWEDDLSPLHSHRELEEPTSCWGEEEIRT